MTTGHRKRADAERNIAAILDAAGELFGHGASPNMTEIAAAAGVGRVTLYAHFPSREVLLESVIERALQDAEATVESLRPDDGPPAEALERAVRSSWRVLDRHRRMRAAALADLGAEWLRERHHRTSGWLDRLIDRGRAAGAFRTDLPRDWLVTMVFSILHSGADEVNAGRLADDEAADILAATVLSVVCSEDRRGGFLDHRPGVVSE